MKRRKSRRVVEDACPSLFYLLCLSAYICWTRSAFDCLHHMKYSTFLGLQVSNPHNANQLQERSFLSEATVQLCHKWTDPDSVSKYQNTRVAAKYDQT